MTHSPLLRRRRAAIAVSAVCTAALVVGLVIWQPWHTGPRLADLGAAPAYTLTDQNGRAVASSSFGKRIQVVSFLSPFCTTYCPYTTHQLALLEQRLVEHGLGERVQFVAFNLAPADSSPADMATYLRQYGVDPADPHWSFLTGSQTAVDAVVRAGFGVDYVRKPLDAGPPSGADSVPVQPNELARTRHVTFDIVHNEVITLVGPGAVVRGTFDHVVDVTTDELYDAVERLTAAS